MRIIADFDGVFTRPEREAEAVGRFQEATLQAVWGEPEAAAAAMAEAREWVRRHPAEAGWFSEGAITCYADEDPYVFHEAVAERLYRTLPEPVIARLRRQGLPDAATFGTHCFRRGTEAWRRSHPSHLEADALAAVRRVVAAGAELVIVSNSQTERVRAILTADGRHPIGEGVRLRGGARKYVLTPDEPASVPCTAWLGGRRVRLRRGPYHAILEEERPDAVIGDVLSLDLALPAALKRAGGWARKTGLWLRRAPHTPAWVLEACRQEGIEPVDSFATFVERLIS